MLRSADEHLAFCKEQALQALIIGGTGNAWASFVHNLDLHPETQMSFSKLLSSTMLMQAEGFTSEKMKTYIERYNPKGLGLS